MNSQDKIAHLKFIIGRYDTYANAVNTKGSFLLAFNSFAAGGYTLKYMDLAEELKNQCTLLAWFQVFSILFIASSVISIWLTIKAVYPSLGSGNRRGAYQSLIYFGSVSELEDNVFIKQFNDQDDNKAIEDLTRQTHQLAGIVSRKFKYISWASYVVYSELLLLIVLFVLFLFNS